MSGEQINKNNKADKFVLRMPGGMRDQIATLAKKSHRSMNAEILRRLEKSIDALQESNVSKGMMADELSPQDINYLLQTLDDPAKQALFGLLRSMAMKKNALQNDEV